MERAASFGLRTTCTKCRIFAIACSSCPGERFCSKGIRRRCLPSTGKKRWRSCLSPWHASRLRWKGFEPMHPARTAAIFLRQLYLMRGSPARILPLFAWVGVDMLLWGFMTRYLNTLNASGPDFVTALLGAVLLWNFFIRVMQGVMTAFLEDVWSRNFLNIFGSPLTVAEYVGGLVLSSIATSAVGVIAMILLATFVFGLDLLAYGVLLL